MSALVINSIQKTGADFRARAQYLFAFGGTAEVAPFPRSF